MQRPALVYDQAGWQGHLIRPGRFALKQALKGERHDLRAEDLAKADADASREFCAPQRFEVRLDLREHVLRTLGPPEDPLKQAPAIPTKRRGTILHLRIHPAQSFHRPGLQNLEPWQPWHLPSFLVL